MNVLPIDSRVKVPHGTATIVAYQRDLGTGWGVERVTAWLDSYVLFRYVMVLDEGHTWNRCTGYAATEDQTTLIEEK